MNRKILAGCLRSREFHERVVNFLDMNEPIQRAILSSIDVYYKRDATVDKADPEQVKAMARSHMQNEKAWPLVDGFVTDLLEQEIPSTENLTQFVLDTREEILARKISICAANPKRNKLELQQLITDYELLRSDRSEGEDYSNYDVERLVEETGKNALFFGPKALRERMGFGAQPGSSILVFARPEEGKSAFIIDSVADVLEQGHPAVHMENEDPAGSVAMRYVSRLSGMNEAQIRRAPKEAYAKALEKGYKNLYVANRYPGTLGDINALVRRCRPTMIAINQMRNLLVKGDTRTNMLEAAASGLRNIAKLHGVVMLSATQAGDSGTNKRVLQMGDVDSSNTGIPAQMDMMIGLGSDESLRSQDLRVISLCKNKLGSVHDNFLVGINRGLSRMEDK